MSVTRFVSTVALGVGLPFAVSAAPLAVKTVKSLFSAAQLVPDSIELARLSWPD